MVASLFITAGAQREDSGGHSSQVGSSVRVPGSVMGAKTRTQNMTPLLAVLAVVTAASAQPTLATQLDVALAPDRPG